MLIEELNAVLSSQHEFKRLIPSFEIFESVFHLHMASAADALCACVVNNTELFKHLITTTDNLLKIALLAQVLSDPKQFQAKAIDGAPKDADTIETLKNFNKQREPYPDEIYLTPLSSQILSDPSHLHRLIRDNNECSVDEPFRKLITLLPNQANALIIAIQQTIASHYPSVELNEIYDLHDLLFLFKHHPILIDEHLARLCHNQTEFDSLINTPKALLTLWVIAQLFSSTEPPTLVTTQQPLLFFVENKTYLFFESSLQRDTQKKIPLSSTFLNVNDIKTLIQAHERRVNNHAPLQNHTEAFMKRASTSSQTNTQPVHNLFKISP